MAKAYVVYVGRLQENMEHVNLCFTCAVKAVMKDNAKIHVETTDYGHTQCDECKEYITDEVTI